MSKRITRIGLLAATFIITLGACQRQPTGAIQPAQVSDESFQVAGDFELHYNAIRTDQLTPEIARGYGIERSKNKVLLNVSVLNKAGGTGPGTSVDADIKVNARNLNAQVKDINLRRIAEASAIYYIGEVGFSGSETLVFDIAATPAGTSTPINATLTREFFAD